MDKIKSLGERQKEYESIFNQKLIRRMFTIIRIDGEKFSSYTSNLAKPFDKGLVDDMIETTKFLCQNIQNCKLGYVQSDEISLILTDFDDIYIEPWFDNKVQKMVSISASMTTGKFNQLGTFRHIQELGSYYFNQASAATQIIDDFSKLKQANFDSRIWQLPDFTEVGNYLRWRQQDATRNSISSCAQALYPHKQLLGKDGSAKQEMIFREGEKLKTKLINCGYIPEPGYTSIRGADPFNKFTNKENFNWNDIPPHLKRGTTISKQSVKKYFPESTYEKDKRPDEIKLNDGWFCEMPTPGEFNYYKMVEEWTATSTDYSSGFTWLVSVLKPKQYDTL